MVDRFNSGVGPADRTGRGGGDKSIHIMHLLEWSAGGERRYILFCRGRFEIAAVEKRTDQGDTPSFRIEIRDRFSDEIIAGRPCNDLEHAAEIFTTLKNAVLDAFLPI